MFIRLVVVFLSLFGLLFSSVTAAAQKPKGTIILVDELLFDLNGDGVTSYDYKIFEDVFKSVAPSFSESVGKSFTNTAEFFVFYCLALREAGQLDVNADAETVENFIKSYRFSSDTIKKENEKAVIENLFRVVELTTIKDRQLQSRQAMMAWLAVLKRKYSLNWKSDDFKNRITFGI